MRWQAGWLVVAQPKRSLMSRSLGWAAGEGARGEGAAGGEAGQGAARRR